MKRSLFAIALLVLALVLVVSTAQQPRAPTSAPLVVTPESSTGASATLDQCRNGGVGATPVPCNPNTKNPLGWVNGNAQGQQAHWREGDSISYRVIITGLTPGSTGNTLLFNWSTVHGSKHAIDYITSYDRTERNTTTPSQFYANNNNPCSDVLGATDCNPALPRTYFPIPSPVTNGVLTNCGGSSGTFVGAIPTGGDMQIKGFGAAGTVITAVAYQSVQDPSGSGQCSTGFSVTFTAGGSTVVLAWGGHIASQADWGIGNSASFISGSPYHMFLDELNGASTGAQDRALATSAIFFTPTITTTVQYDSNNTAVVSPIALGTSVHDNATLTNASSVAGGTVTYNFWKNGACSGTPFWTKTVTVTKAKVPNSNSTGPLAAGSYSFNATYSGDTSSNTFPAFSACEPFTVGKKPTSISTSLVLGASTPLANGATVDLGSSVHDTATITGAVSGVPLTGTVTYHFYTNGTCSAPSVDEVVTISGGTVPPSSSHASLAAGDYSFNATYSGDSNYAKSDSACEPFSVGKAPTGIFTNLVLGTSTPLANESTIALGSSVHDTSTVTGGVSGFPITGTVTYRFFLNGTCEAPAFETWTVAVGSPSGSVGPLPAGDYSFNASYSGDNNYLGSFSACEPFTVVQFPVPPTVSTQVIVTGTTSPDVQGTNLAPGTSVHDTSTLTAPAGSSGVIAPTGTMTYHFYADASCGASDEITSLNGKTWPYSVDVTSFGSQSPSQETGALASGSYSFQAVYSGDANYKGAASPCEPFTVSIPPAVTDTTFCPVSQFRLIYIQKTSSTYTLTASNPGQFYSNVFASLSSPATLSVTINIPYPFVTQGAVPIQVFYNQPLPTCGSTVPSTNVNGEFTISPTSVTLGSYGASPTMGVTTVGVTFTSTGTLPAGLYWFAIHLDYGLKGQTFTIVDQGTGACVNPPNTLGACAAGSPSYNFIGNPQAYGFSNSLSGSNPVTSTNSFNKDPGLAGVVTDSVGDPVAGATVTISGGGITATTTTDQNGFYAFAFKGSGKTVTFTVTATYRYNAVTYTTSGTVTLRLNTIAVLNLSFGGLVL